jgi:hypothetical protein
MIARWIYRSNWKISGTIAKTGQAGRWRQAAQFVSRGNFTSRQLIVSPSKMSSLPTSGSP